LNESGLPFALVNTFTLRRFPALRNHPHGTVMALAFAGSLCGLGIPPGRPEERWSIDKTRNDE
jgi:hypothetical protein